MYGPNSGVNAFISPENPVAFRLIQRNQVDSICVKRGTNHFNLLKNRGLPDARVSSDQLVHPCRDDCFGWISGTGNTRLCSWWFPADPERTSVFYRWKLAIELGRFDRYRIDRRN